jgi:hypothetical protein
MGRLDAPAVAPLHLVRECRTYRQAVRRSWELRRVHFMTFAQIAAEAHLIPQHVSDYLNPDDKPGRRDLPPEKVAEWNVVVGNTLVTQWLAARDQLTVLEELQATKVAA